MLENQINQKSSENIGASSQVNVAQETSQKIYFDSHQATLDFDSESSESLGNINESPRMAKFIQNASVLMKHREYSLAMNLLREASNKDSKNPTTLKLLTNCLEKMSRPYEALAVSKILAEVEYRYENLHAYATALYKVGRDQEALDKYYESLAVLTEESAILFETYKNMGNIFVRQGDFDGAEEYYNKAYTMNPSSDVLLVNLGTLEVQRNDYDKSLYCFRKAVELNVENDKAWVGLAMVHNEFGDSELAWANLESAIDINPKNRTAVHLAANWGLRDGKVQKAIEYLQDYLSEVEEDEDMSLVLINLLCSSGQLDQALLEIERVLLWNPDNLEVRKLKKRIVASQKGA